MVDSKRLRRMGEFMDAITQHGPLRRTRYEKAWFYVCWKLWRRPRLRIKWWIEDLKEKRDG